MKIEELLNIYRANVDFSMFALLYIAKDQSSYLFPNLDYKELKEQGLVDFECKITKKGEEILNKCLKKDEKVSNKIDKYQELHKKLQNKLIELTGSKQKTLNKKYSFLCNSQDLASKLSKVIKKYKLDNWDKIENLLLQHIINSYKANWEYVLLIEYYIEKNNSSKLATDYENFEAKKIETKKADTFDI
jgi:hypothetical protein